MRCRYDYCRSQSWHVPDLLPSQALITGSSIIENFAFHDFNASLFVLSYCKARHLCSDRIWTGYVLQLCPWSDLVLSRPRWRSRKRARVHSCQGGVRASSVVSSTTSYNKMCKESIVLHDWKMTHLKYRNRWRGWLYKWLVIKTKKTFKLTDVSKEIFSRYIQVITGHSFDGEYTRCFHHKKILEDQTCEPRRFILEITSFLWRFTLCQSRTALKNQPNSSSSNSQGSSILRKDLVPKD